MDEELVARLEQEAADADSLDGSPLHEDGQLLRLAAQEIRRLDSVIQVFEKKVHFELYGRRNNAWIQPG